MSKPKRQGEIAAILLALLVASWLLTAMIFAGDLAPPFKRGLGATFGHHLIGKTVISYVVFFAVWLGGRAVIKDRPIMSIKGWTWTTVLSMVLIAILITVLYVGLHLAK
ncbi:MAG: hypothetical protein ABDH63_06950 [Candidatus Caldarchaeales archaeon]